MIRNLEYYRAFYYTANLGSFSEAAERMYVTQSAVSQAIKKLENELDCRFFERNCNPIRLTKEGENLLVHVRQAFAEIQNGEQEIMERKAQRKTKMKIGATETTLYYGVPRRLKEYQQKHPELSIQLCGSTTPELLDLLKNGELEAAYMIVTQDLLQDSRWRGLKIKHLGEVQDRVVVSTSLGLDIGKEWSLKELASYGFVSQSEKSNVYHLIQKWFIQNDYIFEPRYTVGSTAQVLKMVESGMGIGILPEQIISEHVVSGNLCLLKTRTLPKARSFILVSV